MIHKVQIVHVDQQGKQDEPNHATRHLTIVRNSWLLEGFFFGHHYAQNRNFRLRLPSTFLNNLFWNVPMKATPKHKNLETTLSFNLGTLETQCEARQ